MDQIGLARQALLAVVDLGRKDIGALQPLEVDLRIGGTLKTNYNAEGKIGDANTIVHAVLSYEPLRMLSTQNVKAPADFPFAEGTVGTWSISYFTPLEGGKTHVRLVGLG